MVRPRHHSQYLEAFKTAQIGKVHNLPVVITASFAQGPDGPLIEEVLSIYPENKVIYRPGQITLWANEEFVKAVEATGRKKLIMAGVTTDVCLMFPAIQARAAGDVFKSSNVVSGYQAV